MMRFQALLGIVILACSSTLHGQSSTPSGDWQFSVTPDGYQVAITRNDAGAYAGIACNPITGDCRAFLALAVGCEVGIVYPMLVNSSIGASAVTSNCKADSRSPTSEKAMDFKEFAIMRAAFESGGDIGIAFPMEGNQFRVLRFSTRGATAAIRLAMTPPATNRTKGSRRADEVL